MFFFFLFIAISTFLIIGFFHPIVIKTEYYFGIRPWWLFLIGGIICIVCSLLIENAIFSSIVGVVGASMLWSIGELFSQKKRVEKGWFPMNPKRKEEYSTVCQDKAKGQLNHYNSTVIHENAADIDRKNSK